MRYVSTRSPAAPVPIPIQAALEAGLAPDGGLYVPESFPRFAPEDFAHDRTMAEVGARLLAPFFDGDPGLSGALPEICARAFDFPIPLVSVPGRPDDFILELYHGPTAAFKDVGARFLAECATHLPHAGERTVIVATSGDTGGAVGAAFFGKPGVQVVILYPAGRISPRQEKQLCAWGGNVRAFAVEGAFDDCQRMVKETLLRARQQKSSPHAWLSANSINLGRILPQMVYYARASLELWRARGRAASFIIPSGNLGNSLAALWARRVGMPIDRIALALNQNRPVADYLATGTFTPAATITTLANAMDVGNPSNLERLRQLYPALEELRSHVLAESVTDEEIRQEIRVSEKDWGQPFCPHTAVAGVLRKRLPREAANPWVLVATAHPAKFESIVEPLIGHAVEIPPALAKILKQPSRSERVAPTVEALGKALGLL